MYHEVQVIKGQSSKLGKCAEKVNVLIWGDLRPREEIRNPNRESGLRPQESAEAIVPSVASRNREGLNGKRVLGKKFVE